MVDGSLYPKPQRLVSSVNAHNISNPCKFYNHFLFKTVIVIIFIVIVHLLPINPPEIGSKSIVWELLQVSFVGIVVSYGLFSCKNDELEGDNENPQKFDNAQSYLSRLHHVTSIFDEVDGGQCGFNDNDDDNVKKVQTWSSKYVRNEPMLVVAEKRCVLDDNKHGINGEKPLLLPVRSLKSRVSDEKDCDLGGWEDYDGPRVYTRSNSSPIVKGFSNNSKLLGGNDVIGLANEEELGFDGSKCYGRSNSNLSVKRFSNDSKGISGNESVKSRVGVSNELEFVDWDEKVLRSLSRPNTNMSTRDFSRISRKSLSGDYGGLDGRETKDCEEKVEERIVLSSPIPWGSRSGRMEMKSDTNDSLTLLLSPSLEESEAARLLKPQPQLSCSNSSSSTPSGCPLKNEVDCTSIGGSVRAITPSEMRSKEDRLIETEKPERRAAAYDPMSKASFLEFRKETNDFLEQGLLETDDESEREGENREEQVETTKVGETRSDNGNDEESDVDKKAAEFIAKFRGRHFIESIKKP